MTCDLTFTEDGDTVTVACCGQQLGSFDLYTLGVDRAYDLARDLGQTHIERKAQTMTDPRPATSTSYSMGAHVKSGSLITGAQLRSFRPTAIVTVDNLTIFFNDPADLARFIAAAHDAYQAVWPDSFAPAPRAARSDDDGQPTA